MQHEQGRPPAGEPGRLLGLIAQGARDVARLVLPVQCPGCGAWDELVCQSCARTLQGRPFRCEAAVPRLDRMDGLDPLPVWAAARYAGGVRGVVVAWKDRGRADLTPVLVGSLEAAARAIAPVVAAAVAGLPVGIVPVPTTPGARRRRGADLVALLAGGAARGLVAGGVPASVTPVLVRRRGVQDQVGLGARARGRNTARSVRWRGPRGQGTTPGDPRWYVLVDDVVTTGATMAACEMVLRAQGGVVLGALVLAATPAPGAGPGPVAADGRRANVTP